MGMRTVAQERSETGCIITRVVSVHISRLLCIYLIDEIYDGSNIIQFLGSLPEGIHSIVPDDT